MLKTSKEAEKLKEKINKIKNGAEGDNNHGVFDVIVGDESERVKKLATELGVRAYKGIETLAKRFNAINKPDITTASRPNPNALEFTHTKEYTAERATEITNVAEMHSSLTTAFDTAMVKGSEENWNNVAKVLKTIKAKMGNDFEK